LALGLFALMSAMAFGGVSNVIKSRDILAAEAEKWKDLSAFFGRLESDLRSAAPRPVREELGGVWPPLLGAGVLRRGEEAPDISLTRLESGLESGASSVMKRVGYRLRDGKIEYLIWAALDQPPRSGPKAYTVLEGVNRLGIRYLDDTLQWREEWGASSLPRGVEVSVTMNTGETVQRLIAIR